MPEPTRPYEVLLAEARAEYLAWEAHQAATARDRKTPTGHHRPNIQIKPRVAGLFIPTATAAMDTRPPRRRRG